MNSSDASERPQQTPGVASSLGKVRGLVPKFFPFKFLHGILSFKWSDIASKMNLILERNSPQFCFVFYYQILHRVPCVLYMQVCYRVQSFISFSPSTALPMCMWALIKTAKDCMFMQTIWLHCTYGLYQVSFLCCFTICTSINCCTTAVLVECKGKYWKNVFQFQN